jgi:L-histidine Nalpha-methyltransferase
VRTLRNRDRAPLARPALENAAVTAVTSRFEVIANDQKRDARRALAADVRAGLSHRPRSIPPKYFYDERGSRLFDAICELDEYYLTRAETSLLVDHAASIVSRMGATAVVEIGSGMARKSRLLVDALCAQAPTSGGALDRTAPRYVPFDISSEPLEASSRALLARYPRLRVCGVVGDFTYDLPRLASAAPASAGPRLFALLGSTIGNLDECAAPGLVRDVAALLGEGDRFLIGVDLVKAERTLHAAYNDAGGVTAAFNKNVLRVLSRELDADFDEHAFDHLAFYDPERQRIEMHLVSQRAQVVHMRAIDFRVELAASERILTEISRKFTQSSVERTLSLGGMRLREWLSADDGSFALCVASKREG